MMAPGSHPPPYLVTGAGGMLGRDLVELLTRSGIECFRMTHRQMDITSLASLQRALAALRPGTVINAAAYTDVDGAEQREADAFQVNAVAAGQLAEACRARGVVLVHVSTDYVFDGRSYRAYGEDDPVHPQGAYARSKAEGERLIRLGLPEGHCIVRTQWLFGRGGRNFVRSILEAAAQKDVLEVVHDQYGSPSYTADVAEAILRLCRAGALGVFHVRNTGVTTWFRFAEEILRQAGVEGVLVRPITSARLARPAPRPLRAVLDCSKYERSTGHRLRHWREALAAYLNAREREEGLFIDQVAT